MIEAALVSSSVVKMFCYTHQHIPALRACN